MEKKEDNNREIIKELKEKKNEYYNKEVKERENFKIEMEKWKKKIEKKYICDEKCEGCKIHCNRLKTELNNIK